MKRKLIPIIITVLIAVLASAVLFSLRPLGYTAISGEPMLIETAPPQSPLTEITIWDVSYPVRLEESRLHADGRIIDIYGVTDNNNTDHAYSGIIWLRRKDGCILLFEHLHPITDGKTVDFADTEKDKSRRALLEEQLSLYCDFSEYDTFEVFHAAPYGIAGEYLWSVSDKNRSLSVTVTEDGHIQLYIYTDNVPTSDERLPLDDADCMRLVRRALRRDGMISVFRDYTITLSCKDMVYFGEAAIFCTARVVDEDGFVFVQSYTIKRQ